MAIKVGILYNMKPPKGAEFNLEEAIIQAGEMFYAKKKVFPRWAHVNAKQHAEARPLVRRVATVTVIPDRHTLPYHVWLGESAPQ